jgi:excinuclease ABC subunit B
VIHIAPARGQVQHLMDQIRARTAVGERVLVTTLTKRLAEDLANFLQEEGIRCAWLHSELDAFERVEVLRKLRENAFDCVVGVNLLREGLDLPEVSLVAILDADKEGFLRSETSLIQTIGRTARNVNAEVYLYADMITESMKRAIDETQRRRQAQLAYNEKHGITPATIVKAIRKGIEEEIEARRVAQKAAGIDDEAEFVTQEFISELEAEMLASAEGQDYERAAELRDRIIKLKKQLGQPLTAAEALAAATSASRKKERGRKKGASRRGGRVPKPER